MLLRTARTRAGLAPPGAQDHDHRGGPASNAPTCDRVLGECIALFARSATGYRAPHDVPRPRAVLVRRPHAPRAARRRRRCGDHRRRARPPRHRRYRQPRGLCARNPAALAALLRRPGRGRRRLHRRDRPAVAAPAQRRYHPGDARPGPARRYRPARLARPRRPLRTRPLAPALAAKPVGQLHRRPDPHPALGRLRRRRPVRPARPQPAAHHPRRPHRRRRRPLVAADRHGRAGRRPRPAVPRARRRPAPRVGSPRSPSPCSSPPSPGRPRPSPSRRCTAIRGIIYCRCCCSPSPPRC
jgi:hypothetical protein